MTKVAIVVFEDIFGSNGTSVRVHRVLELINRRYSITVIACSDRSQNKLVGMDDVNIRSLGMRPLMYKWMPFLFKLFPVLLWNLKLAFVLLKNSFDVVHCANDWLGSLSIYLVSKVKRYKVIFEAHSIYSEDMKALGYSGISLKLYESLEEFIVKHSDLIITDCRGALEFYQVYNPRIDEVTIFTDTMLFRATARPKTPDSRTIGLIGPFDGSRRQRAYREFLYERVNDFDSRIRFVMIGRCDNKIRHERISYTGYLNSVHDYAGQLCHLDAVLVPERVSTTGPLTKLIEPMSCSLPVFATPKAVLGLEWAEPGKDILVFNENELVGRINELIFNDELMAEIGKNARNVVERHYSKKANEEKLTRLLQLVLEGKQASPLP